MADAVVRHGKRCCGRGVAADVISDVSRTAEERVLAPRAGVGWRKAAMHCESATRAPPGRAFRVAGRRDRRGDTRMCNQNEWIVREAFLAYDRGDVARMMDFVDPDLEWTYLDPGLEDPQPQTCRGRGELEKALRWQADRGLQAELEQVIAAGEKVILVMRTPGVNQYRHWQAGDRTYDVV